MVLCIGRLLIDGRARRLEDTELPPAIATELLPLPLLFPLPTAPTVPLAIPGKLLVLFSRLPARRRARERLVLVPLWPRDKRDEMTMMTRIECKLDVRDANRRCQFL